MKNNNKKNDKCKQAKTNEIRQRILKIQSERDTRHNSMRYNTIRYGGGGFRIFNLKKETKKKTKKKN